ncbi:DUF7521 family protein [Halorarius litoreus]|uniref:DUF7521 family protein n=1 Tax=Halorarius litoreus TaxID=2962676 RepID=UPI0020CBF7A9|nr:hypothetical protein [Halorarius litoreus]
MTSQGTTLLLALKTVTLVVGGLITYYAYSAYRRTRARPLGALAAGFAVVTFGTLLSGGADQLLGLEMIWVFVLESALTATGFLIILYSLYVE